MAGTILIVDDVPEEAFPLVRYLKEQGYNVQFEHSGEEALRSIAMQRPDIIICDLEMPGMGGYQVLEAIAVNSETRNIPFILASSEWTMENWSRPAGGRTADTHASKPYVPLEFVVFIRRILQSIEEDKL